MYSRHKQSAYTHTNTHESLGALQRSTERTYHWLRQRHPPRDAFARCVGGREHLPSNNRATWNVLPYCDDCGMKTCCAEMNEQASRPVFVNNSNNNPAARVGSFGCLPPFVQRLGHRCWYFDRAPAVILSVKSFVNFTVAYSVMCNSMSCFTFYSPRKACARMLVNCKRTPLDLPSTYLLHLRSTKLH
jgi:hypothetical protein